MDRALERFVIPGILDFAPGPGGLTVARISNPLACATVALHGAHVLTYRPAGGEELLWLSQESWYADGQPIRGGIPVCWPWFGGHPSDPALPPHGFVRRRAWQVLATAALPDGATRLRLGLNDDEASRAIWPFRFAAELAVTVGRELTVALTARNPGTEPYTCTGALHTYFSVGDVASVRIRGLEGGTYIDAVNGANTRHRQEGEIVIDQEVDRVYVGTTATCTVDVPAQGRQIVVAKEGSRTTVVWNPWIAKAARMPDFGNDEYPRMLCVETANARDEVLTIPPGGSHTTTAILSVKP